MAAPTNEATIAPASVLEGNPDSDDGPDVLSGVDGAVLPREVEALPELTLGLVGVELDLGVLVILGVVDLDTGVLVIEGAVNLVLLDVIADEVLGVLAVFGPAGRPLLDVG